MVGFEKKGYFARGQNDRRVGVVDAGKTCMELAETEDPPAQIPSDPDTVTHSDARVD